MFSGPECVKTICIYPFHGALRLQSILNGHITSKRKMALTPPYV